MSFQEKYIDLKVRQVGGMDIPDGDGGGSMNVTNKKRSTFPDRKDHTNYDKSDNNDNNSGDSMDRDVASSSPPLPTARVYSSSSNNSNNSNANNYSFEDSSSISRSATSCHCKKYEVDTTTASADKCKCGSRLDQHTDSGFANNSSGDHSQELTSTNFSANFFMKEVYDADKVIQKKGDNLHDNCISRSPQVWICKWNLGNTYDLVDVVSLSSGYEKYIRNRFLRFCELYDQLVPIFKPFFKAGETDFTKLKQKKDIGWGNAAKSDNIDESKPERFKTKLYNKSELSELRIEKYSDLKYSGPLKNMYDTIVLLHNEGLTDNQKDIVVLVALKMYMLEDRNIQREGISNQHQWYDVNWKIIDLCTQEDHGSIFHVQKRCIAEGANIYAPYLEWLGTLFTDQVTEVHHYIQSAIKRAIAAYPSMVSIKLTKQAELDNFLYKGGENALVLHLVRTRDSIRRVVKWIEKRNLEIMLRHLQDKGQAVNKIFQDAFNFLFWETNDNGKTFTQKNIDPVRFLWERIMQHLPTPQVKQVMDIAKIVYSDGEPDWVKSNNISGALNKTDFFLTFAADVVPIPSGDEGNQKKIYGDESSLVVNFNIGTKVTEMETMSYSFQNGIVHSNCSLGLYGNGEAKLEFENEEAKLEFENKTVFQLGAIVSALRLYLAHIFSSDKDDKHKGDVLQSFLNYYVKYLTNFDDNRLIPTLVKLVDQLKILNYSNDNIIEIVNLLVWNAKNFGDAQLKYIISLGFSIIGTTLDQNSLIKLLKNKVPVITGFSDQKNIYIWGDMLHNHQINIKYVNVDKSTYKPSRTWLNKGIPNLDITGINITTRDSNTNSKDLQGEGTNSSQEDYINLNEDSSTTKMGGTFKKYFKYKAKYLQLKNNLITRKL